MDVAQRMKDFVLVLVLAAVLSIGLAKMQALAAPLSIRLAQT